MNNNITEINEYYYQNKLIAKYLIENNILFLKLENNLPGKDEDDTESIVSKLIQQHHKIVINKLAYLNI
jgi:hypothetical protein